MLATGQPQRDLERADARWNTQELSRDFIVHGFKAPFVVVCGLQPQAVATSQSY